jgi:hypothetical protein
MKNNNDDNYAMHEGEKRIPKKDERMLKGLNVVGFGSQRRKVGATIERRHRMN